MQRRKSISIAIPALNEEETIEEVSKEALSELKKLTSNYELFLINDGSSDRTGKIIDKIARSSRHVRVVHHKTSKGFSGVIYASLKGASKQLVLLAPADGQFKFKQLPAFVDAIKHYDVAFGYRVINEEKIIRKVQSLVFKILGYLLLGIRLKEFTFVSLWRKTVIDNLELNVNPKSNMVLHDLILQSNRLGCTFCELPINWYKRKGGQPKGTINISLIFSTLVEMIKLWWVVRNVKVF